MKRNLSIKGIFNLKDVQALKGEHKIKNILSISQIPFIYLLKRI